MNTATHIKSDGTRRALDAFAAARFAVPLVAAIVLIGLASDRVLRQLVAGPARGNELGVKDFIYFSREAIPFETAVRTVVLPQTQITTGGNK